MQQITLLESILLSACSKVVTQALPAVHLLWRRTFFSLSWSERIPGGGGYPLFCLWYSTLCIFLSRSRNIFFCYARFCVSVQNLAPPQLQGFKAPSATCLKRFKKVFLQRCTEISWCFSTIKFSFGGDKPQSVFQRVRMPIRVNGTPEFSMQHCIYVNVALLCFQRLVYLF